MGSAGNKPALRLTSRLNVLANPKSYYRQRHRKRAGPTDAAGALSRHPAKKKGRTAKVRPHVFRARSRPVRPGL